MAGDAGVVGRKAAALLAQRIAALRTPGWQPLPHQIPPTGDWRGWATIAGRGAGKTDSCAHWISEHVKGPPCLPGPSPHWIGIIAPTLGDAATSCFAGPSGLRIHSPDARLVQRAGGLTVVWPNGSEAKLFGAHTPEDVERLRSGGNRCANWYEEMAAWRYLDEAWAHARFGLRVGAHPRWVASTTPKPRPLIGKLYRGELEGVVLTRASFRDNPHLPQHIKDALEEEYGGTQLGRQELEGELIEQDENALWTHEGIAAARVAADSLPKLARVTVGVDPSGGAGEQGIVVAGKALLPKSDAERTLLAHGFVLADRTVRLSPGGWARRAVQAAIDFEADDIAVERNYGGQMAIATIRAAADSMGVAIPIREVLATSGKRIRATPVAALTEQVRWHHAGTFPELENQMCVVAGTLVDTQRGRVPIERLVPGDKALTRQGLAPIGWAGQTAMAVELICLQLQDCELYLTPWHKVYDPMQGRFVPARSVRRGQLLSVSSSVPSAGLWRGAGAGGGWKHTGTTATGRLGSSSTEPYGRRTEDRSQADCWSITGTRTPPTTNCGIWSSRPPRSTGLSTASRGLSRTPWLTEAGSAGTSGLESSRSGGLASSAARASTAGLQRLATVRSVARVELSTSVPVYDLTISDGLPEFYANGILIHNCTWYEELGWSPDRLDAAVWTAWHNKVVQRHPSVGSKGMSLAAARQIG